MSACRSSAAALMRRGLVLSLSAFVLCGAAFVGADSGLFRARALDPAALLPAGTLATITIDGAPCGEFAKELALSKIANEPEVKDLLKTTVEMVSEQAEEGAKNFAKALGTTPEELQKLIKSKFMFAVTRFEMPEDGGEPELDLMLAVELRGNQKTVEALIKLGESQLQSMGGGEEVVKDTTVGGVAGRVIALPPGGPFSSVTYVVHDGWLIAASSAKELEAALARAKSGDPAGSLAADPHYAAGQKEVLRPKTIFSVFMNYAVVMDIAMKAAPPVKKMMGTLGLDSLKTAFYAMELDGASIRERIFGGMTPGSPLLKLTAPMDVSGLLARIPKRSIAAYAVSLDLKAYNSLMTKIFTEVEEMGGGDDFAEVMAEFDKVLGPTWREDLLPNLGPELAMFASMPQYGLFPDVGMLVKVGDRAKVEAVIARLLDNPKAKAAHRSLSYRDVTINYLDLGTMEIDRDLNLRPAYAFVDGYLMVALCPVSAKNLLATMAQKDGGLLARDDFAKTFNRLKAETPTAGNGGIGYVDAQWLAGFLLDAALPLAQCSVPADELEEIPGFDIGRLPTTDVIVRHLSGIVLQGTIKENGTYQDIVSPTGTVGLVAGMGAAAGWVTGVRRRAAFEEAEAMKTEPVPAEPKDDDEPK